MRKKVYIPIVVVIAITVIVGTYIYNSSIESKATSSIENINNQDKNNTREKALQLKTITGKLTDGTPFAPLGISDDGNIYGYLAKDSKNDFALIKYDLDTDTSTTFDVTTDDLRAVFLRENDKYLTWTEVIYYYERRETRIKLYDKETKTSKIIFDDKTFMSLDSSPLSLGDDFVLWISYEVKDNINYPNIKKYCISTGETTTYRENAINPVICNDFIAFEMPDTTNPNIAALYVEDLKTNKIQQITYGKHIQYIDGQGEHLVVAYEDNNEYYLSIYENGKLDIIESNKAYAYEFPRISKNFITWRCMQLDEVYDTVKKEKIKLEGISDIVGVYVSDNCFLAITRVDREKSKEQSLLYGFGILNMHIGSYAE